MPIVFNYVKWPQQFFHIFEKLPLSGLESTVRSIIIIAYLINPSILLLCMIMYIEKVISWLSGCIEKSLPCSNIIACEDKQLTKSGQIVTNTSSGCLLPQLLVNYSLSVPHISPHIVSNHNTNTCCCWGGEGGGV